MFRELAAIPIVSVVFIIGIILPVTSHLIGVRWNHGGFTFENKGGWLLVSFNLFIFFLVYFLNNNLDIGWLMLSFFFLAFWTFKDRSSFFIWFLKKHSISICCVWWDVQSLYWIETNREEGKKKKKEIVNLFLLFKSV